ncbi:MAG: class I adenylate-forming enzyme family protein [Bacillota bacterium]|nr:class I adenylate-forming enzyme family protein [Bacillota bacterium]
MIKSNLKTVYEAYEDFIKSQEPKREILHFYGKTITAEEFEKNVDNYTYHLIKLGIKSGDKVGYTMANRPELFYIFISIARLGACAVPLFHMIPDLTKATTFKNINVKCVITTSEQFPSLKEASEKINAQFKLVTIEENSLADYTFSNTVNKDINILDFILKEGEGSSFEFVIASSSGTTGIPKRIAMTQSNIASEIYAAIELGRPTQKELTQQGYKRINIAAFPLSTSGMITQIGSLLSGNCQIYSSDVSPVKYLELITMWKPTTITAPPAFFEAILSLPNLNEYDLTSVNRISSGMDFISPSLIKRLKDKFVNIKVFSNGYGLSETCNVIMTYNTYIEENQSIPTNIVKLVENIGNEIDIRDEEGNSIPPGSIGELYVKGNNVVSGYLNNETETLNSFKDGWFKTGDIVRNEGNNTITLLGRKKYLIKRGGKSISPIVVQNYINKLNGVKSSAVVGVPHPLYGEMIWAFIVKHEGAEVELKDIMKHCRSQLANYMVPDQVTFIDDIPKNSGVGKVNFEKLKQIAEAELKNILGGAYHEQKN